MPRPKPNYGTKYARLFVYNCIFLNCSWYRDFCIQEIGKEYIRVLLIGPDYAMVVIGTVYGGDYFFYRYAEPGYRYCKDEWCFRQLGLVGVSNYRPVDRICLCKTLEKI